MRLQMILVAMHTAQNSAALLNHFCTNPTVTIFGSMLLSQNSLILCHITQSASQYLYQPLPSCARILVSTLQSLFMGMSLIKAYRKGSALFDAATASGMRRMQPGTHWPTHICSAAIKLDATFSC